MRSPFEKGALGRIVALVLVGVLGVWLVYDLVDAVSFFAQDHHQLRPMGIAVMVGAPLLIVFWMLSIKGRRQVGSWFLGVVACAMTGFAVYLAHSCWRLREVFAEGGGGWLMALICLMVLGYAAWFWWLAWDVGHRRPRD